TEPVEPTPEPTPTLTIAADAATFTEGDDASADFTVTASPAPTDDLPVVVTLTNADDFVDSGERTQTITILADALTATASFTIANDTDREPTATATATINANAAAYNLGSPSSAMATISDDDTPTLSIVANQMSITESSAGAMIAFTVTSTRPAPVGGLTATVTLTGANDFVAAANRAQTITIAANTDSTTASFAIDDDDVPEATATATATIGANAAAYNLGSPSSATTTINDDDGDVTLSDLSLDSDIPLTLEPRFDPLTPRYTATVAGDVTGITVTAVPDSRAACMIDAAPCAGGVMVMFETGANGEAVSNELEITITVTAGGKTHTYVITVTRSFVTPAEIAAENAVVESLPALTRAFAEISNASIAARIEQVVSGGGLGGGDGNFNFARTMSRVVVSQKQAIDAGRDFGDGMKALLDGSVVALPFSGVGDGGATPALWVGGDYRDLGGDHGETDWDGDIASLQLGADLRLANDMLAGVAVAMTESEIDYADRSAGDALRGTQEMSLTSIHPYLGWQVGALDLWASFAYAAGELERRPDGAAARADDLGLVGVSLGGGGDLAHFGANRALRIKGEISASEMTV
ncbi:MAG: cadherin-like beta sandwich domain-containing protein, partial [bacterium]